MSSLINLNSNFNPPVPSRLEFSRPDFNDEVSECYFSVMLRSNGATNAKYCAWSMIIRNGTSDKAARQSSPAAGLNIEDIDRHIIRTTRSTPTGYTDLLALWSAGGNQNGRQTAFVNGLYSGGHMDSTLAGT